MATTCFNKTTNYPLKGYIHNGRYITYYSKKNTRITLFNSHRIPSSDWNSSSYKRYASNNFLSLYFETQKGSATNWQKTLKKLCIF